MSNGLDLLVRHDIRCMDLTKEKSRGRHPAFKSSGTQLAYHPLLDIVHLAPHSALVCTTSQLSGAVTDPAGEYRVPPEPGHADVSFWYAT